MKPVIVEVSNRSEHGASASKRLRKNGFIPAVIYSKGKEALSLMIDELHYSKTVGVSQAAQLFEFKSDAEDINGLAALVKKVQREPIKSKVLHVDFYLVTEDHSLTVSVPISLSAVSPAIKQGLAVLNHITYEVEVQCVPREIPSSLELDISNLNGGESLHAGDIPLPSGLVLKSDPKLTIVSAIAKRQDSSSAEEKEASEDTAEDAAQGASKEGS